MRALLPILLLSCAAPGVRPKAVEIPADVLEDKIRGGLLGQILGNLNGLPHEFKYIDELKTFPNVVREIFNAPQPVAAELQARARAEGLTKPK